MSENEISIAVQDCLVRCYEGHTPLGVIADFVGELRDQGWEETDIQKVETVVRRVLAAVLSPMENSKR